ncbi:hypothetical protein [Bosea sp. BK604]|uniref:hypothetical protein n=1 Tax=Bosea sp. BK604 TaxID=2512180 RepID=UPI001043C8E2|nr:hypothetical protein [Bosea sp. BK604]
MDRRSFVTGLLAIAAGGVGALAVSEASAAPGTAEACTVSDAAAMENAGALDELPAEYAQYHRRPTHWHHRHSRHRHHRRHARRRYVCRVHHDRWGRRVRRCHWVWG